MKILVFGIGGIGGWVGGALAKVSPSAYFCARGDNLKAIKEKGIQVESELLGDFLVKSFLAGEQVASMGTMDVILLSCKGNNLEAACRDIEPAISEGMLVVPQLNGVLVSRRMKSFFPDCALVADGTIRVFSHREGPGHVVQTAGSGKIVMGMDGAPCSQQMEKFATLLAEAGIPVEITEDIALDSWEKYALMGSNSALFCAFDGNAGEVRSRKDFLPVVHEAVREVIAVAGAEGVCLPESYEEEYVNLFLSLPPDTVTSLYRDLKSGKNMKDTEADMILGNLVQMGKKRGIHVPVFRRVWEWACGR